MNRRDGRPPVGVPEPDDATDKGLARVLGELAVTGGDDGDTGDESVESRTRREPSPPYGHKGRDT